MAAKTLTEQILMATDKELSNDAVETTVQAARKNRLVFNHLNRIVAHEDFPEQYQAILSAMDMAENLDVTDKHVLYSILRPDVSPSLMEDAVFSAHEGVSREDLDFIFDSIEANMDDFGYTKQQAEDMAVDMMVCRRNGINRAVVSNSLFAKSGESYDLYNQEQYTPEQLRAVASVSSKLSVLAVVKQNELKDNSLEPRTADYLRGRLISLIDSECGFDSCNTPAQIEAIGKSITTFIEPLEWNGVFSVGMMDELQTIKDAICSHDSYEVVYDNIINGNPYDPDDTIDWIWTKAKDEEVNNEIINSPEAVNDNDPIPGLKRICKNIGLDENTTNEIAEKAEPLISQSAMLKEHNAENQDLKCVANMLIEGIPPEDVFDYSKVVGHDRNSLATLYTCYHGDISKEVTLQCLSNHLDSAQMEEVIAGKDNGLSDDQLMKLAVDKRPIELCKMRISMQNEPVEEHEQESVMADKAPEKEGVWDKVADNQKNIAAREAAKSTKAKTHTDPEH